MGARHRGNRGHTAIASWRISREFPFTPSGTQGTQMPLLPARALCSLRSLRLFPRATRSSLRGGLAGSAGALARRTRTPSFHPQEEPLRLTHKDRKPPSPGPASPACQRTEDRGISGRKNTVARASLPMRSSRPNDIQRIDGPISQPAIGTFSQPPFKSLLHHSTSWPIAAKRQAVTSSSSISYSSYSVRKKIRTACPNTATATKRQVEADLFRSNPQDPPRVRTNCPNHGKTGEKSSSYKRFAESA